MDRIKFEPIILILFVLKLLLIISLLCLIK